MREQHGSQTQNVGFSTYTGSVTAADDWGGPARFKRVRPGLQGSYEQLFHDTGMNDFYLNLADAPELEQERLARAIGVIYRPQTERASHYYHVNLPRQFNHLIFLNRSHALERTPEWEPDEAMPDTFPFGI